MSSSRLATPAGGVVPSTDAVAALARQMRGELVRPGDPGYDVARRVWNGMIDRQPGLVARCADTRDVVEVVRFAREQRVPLAVRGGGHNVAGFATCDGGIVLDLGAMDGVEVDPERRVARVGGGARWRDVDAATQPFGLATPGGVVSDTGVAGLTLSGGFGWLSGKLGLSCDNLIGAEVVLADGSVVEAGDPEHAELLWGLRGGGGNFGVVTRLDFRLHPVGPEIALAFVFYDARGNGMRDLIRAFRDECARVPDEVAPLGAAGQVPPGHHLFPAEVHGVPFFLVAAAFAGPAEEGMRRLEPLRRLGTPLLDLSGRMPYVQAQTMFDEDYPAYTLRYYWKSLNLDRLTDEMIEVVAEHALRQPSPLSTTDIWCVGAAVRRGPDDSAAFAGRQVPWVLNPEANWADPADDGANVRWVRDFHEAMRPFASGGGYLNFPGFLEEGERLLRATFGPKYERLRALKRRYDPENLFRLNQNVAP